MRLRVGEGLRRAAEVLGPRASNGTLDGLQSVLDSAQTAAWLSRQGLLPSSRVQSRWAVFEWMLAHVHGDSPLYLEFGVYRGESIRWWSRRLESPQACLFGFDTFSGVPTSWTWQTSMQIFDVNGRVPRLEDPRVQFITGTFEETLPHWLPPSHDQVIVTIDCDIYESARTALSCVSKSLKSGDLLYFDEFKFFHDERRAFAQMLASTGLEVADVVAARGLRAVAFLIA